MQQFYLFFGTLVPMANLVFYFKYVCDTIQHIVERVKFSRVEVYHGDSPKKFPVYEIYLDGVIVTKVSSKTEAEEMVSRWQEVYK